MNVDEKAVFEVLLVTTFHGVAVGFIFSMTLLVINPLLKMIMPVVACIYFLLCLHIYNKNLKNLILELSGKKLPKN